MVSGVGADRAADPPCDQNPEAVLQKQAREILAVRGPPCRRHYGGSSVVASQQAVGIHPDTSIASVGAGWDYPALHQCIRSGKEGFLQTSAILKAAGAVKAAEAAIGCDHSAEAQKGEL